MITQAQAQDLIAADSTLSGRVYDTLLMVAEGDYTFDSLSKARQNDLSRFTFVLSKKPFVSTTTTQSLASEKQIAFIKKLWLHDVRSSARPNFSTLTKTAASDLIASLLDGDDI